MAIIREGDPYAEHIADGPILNFECSFCHEKLTFPFIHWSPISLHPQCVLDWWLRLSRDLWELKQEDNLVYISEGQQYRTGM